MTLDELTPAVQEDLRRLISYGWLPGIIAHLLNRTHGLELTSREVKMLTRHLAREEKNAGANTHLL